MLSLEEINSRLQVPEHDRATPVSLSEARFIYDFVERQGFGRTLEVGLAYGRSASHIIAASRAKHVAIDPFQKSFSFLGLKNIEQLGLSSLLEHRDSYSHIALAELLSEGRTFDFVFIDGDHRFDFQMLDFYYASLLLEQGGYILLHDVWMRSTRHLMSFIERNRKDFVREKTRGQKNLALYKKVGKDSRSGMHFREFYTLRSLLSNALCPLKSMLFGCSQ